MESVTVERVLAADPEAVRESMLDVEPFMRAAGFDEVSVDGDRIDVANEVGPVRIALELAVVDRPDAVLAYEQREGIFEEMETTYAVAPAPDGTTVAATTTFSLDAAVVGPVLDATVIRFQRRRELNAQFDHVEETAGRR